MQFIEEEIRKLAPSIWEAVLKLPLESDDTQTPDPGRYMAACVHIAGAWNGAVALSCGADFASVAAKIMFDLPEDAPTTADMQDSLGELVNMVGGNIKALLPEPSHLSLPSVVEGIDYSVRVPGSKVLACISFRCGKHPMSISLLERFDRAA